MMVKAPLDPVRRVRQRAVDIALGDAEFPDQVGVVSVVQHRGARLQRRFGIDQRRQRFEIDGDQLGRVFREIAALGQDHRDRLADVPHLVMGQQRLLRIEEGVLDLRGPFPRQRQLGVGHRGKELGQLRAVQHIGDARRRGGARQVDRADARVRHLAAHEHRMQRVGQLQIGDELAAAQQQAAVLATRHRAADISAWSDIVFHLSDPALTLLAPHRLGGGHHRRDDVLIAGATAQHRGQRLAIGSLGVGLTRRKSSAAMSMPGVQKPHCRP